MFSVVIPYYKKRKYIERCLNSVIDQTFKDFEIILVDDGSDDDICELINDKYSLSVQLIQQKNQGVSAARNIGIAHAKYDYIAFLDADDLWGPQFLSFVKIVIERENNVKIIGTHYSKNISDIFQANKELNYFEIKDYFRKVAIKNTLFTSSTSVISKSFFNENKGFNTRLKTGEDIDVWIRAVASGGNIYYISNTLVYYSDEDDNQATVTPKKLEDRYIGNIKELYFSQYTKIDHPEFYTFIEKYIYRSLYLMYFQKDNHKFAKETLNLIEHKLFFAEIYYKLPQGVMQKLVHFPLFRKMARKYFKLIF